MIHSLCARPVCNGLVTWSPAYAAGMTGMDDLAGRRHEALRTVQQFLDWVGFCGCGSPGPVVLGKIKTALSWFCGVRDGSGAAPLSPMLVLPPAEARDDFLLYLLDAWGLTQHGGSVYGSWLTPDGERLRVALGLVDVETFDDVMGESGPWWEEEARRNPGEVLSYGVWEPQN